MIVNRDERRGRASSFGAVADAYERARPEYPEAAVRWLAGDKPADVVDLGAGTGKLTRGLIALGHRVTAVEPLAVHGSRPSRVFHTSDKRPPGRRTRAISWSAAWWSNQ